MNAPLVPVVESRVLSKVLRLPYPQMRIVLFYLMAAKDPEFNDAVVMTGERIAEEIGMNRPLLSKTIPRLLEEGWLREASKHGNVRYYGLGPLALAEPEPSNVVPLRRTA